MYNATIYVEKTSGSIDRVITLLVTGCKLSKELVNTVVESLFLPLSIKEAKVVSMVVGPLTLGHTKLS